MYTWKTFGASKTDLQQRLGSVNFWSLAEIGLYIQEALRTFNSIALFYRDRCVFTTTPGFAFYDLTAITGSATHTPSMSIPSLPSDPSSPSAPDAVTLVNTAGTGSGPQNPPAFLGYNLLDRDLISIIEYHLIEPQTAPNWSLPWAGTEQFTLADITRAIERRRNQFLTVVGTHISHGVTPYGPPSGNGRIFLNDSIIDIKRVSFQKQDGTFIPLTLIDEQEANTTAPGYETSPATPIAFSSILQPPKGIQIIPPSNDIGTIDLLFITNPPDLNEVTGIALNIPDDLAWIIKWGALADLLDKEGQAYDPDRAKYCEQRFEDGLKVAMAYDTIYQVAINGQYVLPSSLYDFDFMNWNWQNISGQPTDVALIGRNLIALSPVPDAAYSIQLDILRNMPIPVLDADFIQVGREHYDIILDYAAHLAFFKTQGAEFHGSYPMLDRFMQFSMMNNSKLAAMSKNYSIMREHNRKEEMDRPMLRSDVAAD